MANRSDNFNRANAALNGSTPSDGGSAWSCTNGGSIVSNAFQHNGNSIEYNILEASTSDVDIAAVLTVLPSAFSRCGLVARGSDSSNFWFAEIRVGSTSTTAGTWQIFKRVAGTNTSIVSTTGPALATNATLRFNAVGDRLRLYHTPSGGSESLILDTNTGQTFNQTATKHGLGGAFPNGQWDSFSITDLAAAASSSRRRRLLTGAAA